MFRSPHRPTVVTLLLVAALAACGGSSGDDDGSASDATEAAAPAETADVAATETTGDDSADGAEEAADEADDESEQPDVGDLAGDSGLAPICETIPSLDELSALVGSPLTTVTDNSEPTVEIAGETIISDRCDVSGDDLAAVIFDRWDAASAEAVIEQVTADGMVADYVSSAFPTAVAWANGLIVEQSGVYYQVAAITPETVGQADAPAAYALADELLQAWIG